MGPGASNMSHNPYPTLLSAHSAFSIVSTDILHIHGITKAIHLRWTLGSLTKLLRTIIGLILLLPLALYRYLYSTPLVRRSPDSQYLLPDTPTLMAR